MKNISVFLLLILIIAGCSLDSDKKDESGFVFKGFPEAVTTLKGWELDETNTGLKGDYSKLTEITVSDVGCISYGNLVVNIDNITISDKFIPYTVIIEADGVVFERCMFQPASCGTGMPLIFTQDTRVVFRDCEMDFSGIPIDIVYFSIGVNLTGEIYRCNIYGAATGISIHNPDSGKASVAEGNYIHDLRYREPAHVDGLTVRNCSGSGGMVIRNNKIIVDVLATGPLFMQALQGHIDNVLVEGNLLQGYGSSLVIEYNKYGYGGNIQAVNNRLDSWNTGGGGPWFGYHDGGPGWAVWEENYVYDAASEDCKGPVINEL